MPRRRGVSTTATCDLHSRNFERELRDRLRIVAAARGESMEAVLNQAVNIGLRIMERDSCQPAATR